MTSEANYNNKTGTIQINKIEIPQHKINNTPESHAYKCSVSNNIIKLRNKKVNKMQIQHTKIHNRLET